MRCTYITSNGKRCKRIVLNKKCWQHKNLKGGKSQKKNITTFNIKNIEKTKINSNNKNKINQNQQQNQQQNKQQNKNDEQRMEKYIDKISIKETKDVLPENPEYKKYMKDNYHLSQIASYQNEEKRKLHIIPFKSLKRILLNDDPRKKYEVRKERRTVNHWGQRKLFLSEIEFLTLYSNDGDTVVYAGAAPGTHTKYLSDLFPTIKFVLVDPSPFIVKPEKNKIEVRNEFFTDEMAAEFSDRDDVLFICDIRTADYKVLTIEEVEDAVERDQEYQMKWHLIMKPRYSMLKFRLPWGKGTTEYLDGDIFLQIWAPQSSTETRLIVHRDAKIKKYDHTKYEEQMFYFNTITRVNYYARDFLFNVPGLDHCYDCSAEILVILQYFIRYDSSLISNDDLFGKINKFIYNLSHHCSPHSGRTLLTHIEDDDKKWFSSKIFDTEKKKLIDIGTIVKEKRDLKKKDEGLRKERTKTIDPSIKKYYKKK